MGRNPISGESRHILVPCLIRYTLHNKAASFSFPEKLALFCHLWKIVLDLLCAIMLQYHGIKMSLLGVLLKGCADMLVPVSVQDESFLLTVKSGDEVGYNGTFFAVRQEEL